MIIGFLATIILSTVLGLLGPLLVRKIFDVAIPDSNGGYLNLLALVMIGAAVGEAALSLLERWWSSRIGEGLIYDLRVRLFDHVQRMPMGFFTRTQTGALISRLNNDVIGAQRAFTGTLGTVVSNVITLVGTPDRHAAARMAPDPARGGRSSPCSSSPPSGSGATCRRSRASRWTSTPR